MADIFFSYKREEGSRVEPIIALLQQRGWSVFWDRDIKPGTPSWNRLIENELESALCIVVAWSALSADSPWVEIEAHYGRTQENLVPLSLDGNVPITFQLIQTVDLSDWAGDGGDERINALCNTITRYAGDRSVQEERGQPQEEKSSVTPVIQETGNEAKDFETLMAAPTLAGCTRFLARYGDGPHAFVVRAQARKLEKDAVEGQEEAQKQQRLAEASRNWESLKKFGGDAEAEQEFFQRYAGDNFVFRDFDQGPEMVLVSAGTFMMGSSDNEAGRAGNEFQHEVTLTQPFAIGRYPVTFGEWDAYVADSGRGMFATKAYSPKDQGWGRDRRSVINVSWDDAEAYIFWLNGKSGKTYSLPTEAQWEYACRAGTTTAYAFGDEITPQQANFDKNIGKTIEVGSYPANGFGLHEMHGNVWEWCQDWHDGHYYNNSPAENPQGPESGSGRVIRGGGWDDDAGHLRSANRIFGSPGFRNAPLGFRLMRQPS